MFLPRSFMAVVYLLLMPIANAQESDWTRAFDLIWETQWQQNGVLTNVSRWPVGGDKVLRYSINSKASSGNSDIAREAIVTVTTAMGFSAKEVVDRSEDTQVRFDIRHFDDTELRQYSCYAQPTGGNGVLTRVNVVMSDQYAYMCALHELMHAMGLPGHPSGDSVLSYFPGNRQSFKQFDRFILKAWYSDAIQPGMPAIAATRALNNIWIDQNVAGTDQMAAREAENRWFHGLIASLDAYAFGKGEPPAILYRSGRLNPAGRAAGLIGVQNTLADAYFNGLAGEKNVAKSAQLLMLSANSKSRYAANEIAFKLFAGDFTGQPAEALCKWLKGSSAAELGLHNARFNNALSSEACTQQ